ncbi:MAG TPA: CHAT domain-containing protein [Pyrinomonadaceae bacterium]
MEQTENKGRESLEEQEAIKKYLLGALSDKVEMRLIEEKILLDDDFAEKLSVAEDNLIDEYLDGSLAVAESRQFQQFFINVPERKQKLRLIRDLRKYAAENQTAGQFTKEKGRIFDWRKLVSLPSFRLAAAAILLLLFGFIIWRAVFFQSDLEKGRNQLLIATRGQRLTESRTTLNSNYASVTRGGADAKDEKAMNHVGMILAAAAENSSDPEAHHTLGLFYLVNKKYDNALEELKRALELAPNDAKLHNDIGALYFEKAQGESGGEVSVNLNLSRQHFERAIELNENLLEALFNNALVLQKIPLTNQAREAWQKYLEKDSTSPWADEARKNLQRLQTQNPQSFSDADKLENAFLNEARQKNDVEAGQLISQNRELIKKKYLPQKLAMSLVEADGDKKKEYLQALVYAGELEEKNTGDLFARDLAAFYVKIPESNFESLRQAQDLMKKSYQFYLHDKNEDASEQASRAQQLFLQAGDVYEAKLSEFIIAYCQIKGEGTGKSIQLYQEIADFCGKNNYKWLLANTLYWLAGAQRSIGERTQANINYKDCYNLAKELGDAQVFQKILVSYASRNKFVGQNQAALAYLEEALDALGSSQDVPLREKWRTYSASIEIFSSLELYNLAKAIALENIQIANDENDSLMIANSCLDAGIVYTQAGDFDQARIWLDKARRSAEALSESSDKTENLAKSLLTSGYLESRLGNFTQAAQFYDEAFGIVANREVPFYLYEIEKSRLLTDISLNKDAEIEEQINKTINLAEKYRKEISKEKENISFFNNQQEIYDIATLSEFKHENYEQAYNYLETSNSRAMLDWLKKGVNVEEEKKEIEITFKETAEPLLLNEIRAQMPDQVQILQYAVLENNVLIWLISKDDFTVVSSEIKFEELKEKVVSFNRMIVAHENQNEEITKLSRELYNLLITPIASHLDPNRKLCLIPQKILFHLPFAALMAPDDKPFLAQFDFFYAPSANTFLLFTENARKKSALTNESLLSVGNPSFDRKKFKELQDLPESEDEAREITQFYSDKQTLIGSAATKTAIENLMKNAEVINLAGHYIVRHGEPLASGFLLTKPPNSENSDDGILTNAELIRQAMPRAKLVVLSACQTGIEQYYNGEGLVGLSTTFLKAGVPLVVASQWPVDSSAAAELMKNFHMLRRQEKLSTAAALRRAQLEMMETPGGKYSQPYFWAAFATYGGYAEF